MNGIPDFFSMLVGGEFRPASDGATVEAVDPATGRSLARFPAASAEDVDHAVRAAERAAPAWAATAATARAERLVELAGVIEEHAEEIAEIDTADGGSLRSEMRRDVRTAVSALRYFAGLALQLRGATVPGESGRLTYSVREPFGVVGRIVPFNHPFMFAASRIAAPLVAGNTVVLKPSEDTSLSALRLAQLAHPVLPPGVLNVVTGWGPTAGDALVAHPGVRRLAFTGSVATGLAVARRAAESGVTTVSLELGGKNPLVVFPDADLETAVEAAVRGMNFTWQGQSCGSLSRVLVHDDVHEAFLERLVPRVAALRPGLPDDPASDTGAVVSRAQTEKVLDHVQRGVADGARLHVGGDRVTGGGLDAGNFVRPAVFSEVDPESSLGQEEIFGPVLSVLRFSDERQAIALANGTRYGLTAAVYTRDLGRAHRFAAAVHAGYVWINEVSRHIPGAGFGGVKDSGTGREEDIEELLSYTQTKTVHVHHSA